MEFITIWSKPFGKQRPKVNKRFGSIYTPENTRRYEKEVAAAWNRKYKDFKYDENVALEVKVIAYFNIPKSYTKKRRQEIIDNNLRPLKKPDGDNIMKVILDGLNGVAFADDKQVTTQQTKKRYACIGEERVEVYVKEDV